MGTYYGGLYSSTNNGTSWNYLSQDGNRVEGLVRDNNGNLFFAGASKSTDNGVTWNIDTAGLGNTYTNSLIITPNNTLFASANAGLFKKQSNETQWTRILGTGSFYIVDQALYSGNNTVFASVSYSPTQTDVGLWRSSDNGSTWEHIATPDSNLQNMTMNSLGHIYLESRTGVYRSNNNGANWVKVSGTPWPEVIKTNVNVYGFAFDGSGKLYAATSAALFKSQQTTLSIKENVSETPKEFSLEQNYPNPFNPTTVIRYSLPVNGLVTLKVFDVLGEEIATLVNQNLSVGKFSIEWNADNVPSGIYFYKLSAGKSSKTKKMLLGK